MNSQSVFTALTAALLTSALADHPTISLEQGGTGGPITTISGYTAPKGAFGVSTQSQIIYYDQISDEDLKNFSFLGAEGVHSTQSLITAGTNFAYGVTDRFTLGMSLPYVWRNNLREAHHGHVEEAGAEAEHHEEEEAEHGAEEGTVDVLGDVSGLGDIPVYGKFQVLRDEQSHRFAAVIAGLKTPTGRTDSKTNAGELFEAHHQAGSGSWDPMAGFAFTQGLGAWSVDTNVLYTFVNDGSQDTNLGDIFNYNLALSYRLGGGDGHHHENCPGGTQCPACDGGKAVVHDHHDAPAWDFVLEANGDWREEVNIAGAVDGNTGGHILYLSAGTRVLFPEGWAGTLSVGLPAIENLNGIQSDPDVRILTGFSKSF
jgi:hypothetical protein